jgi:RNA polymerase sigma-70 factor (ECF subfamily)
MGRQWKYQPGAETLRSPPPETPRSLPPETPRSPPPGTPRRNSVDRSRPRIVLCPDLRGMKMCKVSWAAGYSTMTDSGSGYQTRPSLLLRLRDPQDAQAWGVFVGVYGPLVYGHARRRGLQHQDAEDVAQKAFARVTQAIRTFDYQPDLGRFRDWLGTVVRNEIHRFLKRESSVPQVMGSSGADLQSELIAPVADTDWTSEFNARVLQVALDRSRPRFEAATWQAFERVWLQDVPAAKVADEMGKPIDWVYVAKSRVLKQLWDEVQELADDAALVMQSPR